MTLRDRVKGTLHVFVPRKLTAKEIAFSGVMAAVMAVAAFIPVTVVAGVGKVISAAVMLEPLLGVLLGPVLGTYSAAAGAFAGQILAPQGAIFGLLTFIPPTVGAAAAGFLAHKHWKAACGIMAGVLLLWYSTSIGRELYYYPYMPLIFLGLALLFRGHLGEWIHVKYNEIVGFRGAGIRVMMAGLFLIVIAFFVITLIFRELYSLGVVSTALAVMGYLGFQLRENDLYEKCSALAFVAGGILLFVGIAMTYRSSLFTVTGGLLCITFVFLALHLSGHEYNSAFLFSFALFGVAAGITLVRGMPEITADAFSQILLQRITYALVIVGIFLFLLVHLQNKIQLRKWSGLTLFLGGFIGLIQQFLLLSLNFQVIRRELLRLDELLPFTTSVLEKEVHVTSVLDYYTKKVFPVYVGHTGWFLIFLALIILGISFFLNISLEKLSVAYFIISGFAVLSDLMIGNFLAIQVLELKAGMFKAFLFIYPVERIFMALFATIFGVGVIIPLKKFGLSLIRR